MKTYVILLNWNNAKDTLECVDSLIQLDYKQFDILICDNDSADEDLTKLINGISSINAKLNSLNDTKNIEILKTGGNLGFAGGVNFGIRHVIKSNDYDYIWILNNDTVVSPDALSQLVTYASENNVGICGSSLVYYHEREKLQALGGAHYYPWTGRSKAIGAFKSISEISTSAKIAEEQMSYVIGASMLVSKAFIEAIGVMHEEYFLYSEELDWAHRGVLKGQRLGYAPKSIVYHKHGATIGTNPSGGSLLSLYYLYRSKVLFTRAHYPQCLPSVMFVIFWDMIKFVLKRAPKKAIALARGLYSGLFDKGISD